MSEKGMSGSTELAQDTPADYFCPADAAELQEIVAQADRTKKSLSVYSTAVKTDLAVSFARMNHILEIDAANLLAIVEPGLKLGDLALALKKESLRFMPAETPFHHEKSVGEFYFEGCSNICSMKYGSAKHFLLGTEVVLADGRQMKTGGKTVKNVTGYDMTRFMNAPFASFGITVRFLLKLLPDVEARQPVEACFGNAASVNGFVKDLREAKIVPKYLIWADPQALSLSGRKGGAGSFHFLSMELDGIMEEVTHQHEIVLALMAKHGSTAPDECGTKISGDSMWKELFTPSRGYALTDEIKVKRTDAPGFIDKFHPRAQEKGVKAGLFGQVAEGKINIYFEELSRGSREFMEYLISILPGEGGYSTGRYSRLFGLGRVSGPLDQTEMMMKKLFDPNDTLKG